MKIILAPTKKQNTETQLKYDQQPQFIEESNFLRTIMSSKTTDQLKSSLKTSDKLTQQVYSYYHDEQTSVPAAALYTGAVFNAADFRSWNHEDINYAKDRLIILSALYGPLSILDKTKPYRLDFFTKLDFKLYDFWQEKMDSFNHNLKGPIINLASKEFSKMIPNDLLVDIRFQEPNGKVQSAHAKKARGTMVKYIIKNRINTLEELKKFNLLDYSYKKDQSSNKKLVFAR